MWHLEPIRNPGARVREMFLYALYASTSGKPSSMLPSSTFLQDPMAHSGTLYITRDLFIS